jgi:hypothetical protein
MYRTVFAGFIVSVLLLSGRTLLAQGGLPPGDYKQTCREMRSNGSRLDARCQKRDGGWRDSSIDYRSCRGPIINDDGRLRCGAGGGGYGYSQGRGWQGGLPPGDYTRTCRDTRVNGDRLDASCQKRDGGWRNTTLKNFNNCSSGIVNDDGRLTCQR